MKKFLFGLAPLLAVAAFALVPAVAQAENEPCMTNVLCNNANVGLRDDLTEPPEAPEPAGGFGTDGLAVNTVGPLRLCETTSCTVANKNPKGDAFFGIKLDKNPKTSSAVCEKAKGWVQWADLQNATSGLVSSPVFAGTAIGYNGPWNLTVTSDQTVCGAEAGEVKIGNFAIYLPVAKWRVTTPAGGGAIVGTWVQPSAAKPGCEAGGIRLKTAQTLLINGAAKTAEIDNGAGEEAYLCFVSANNYVYPKNPPEWKELKGSIWKD